MRKNIHRRYRDDSLEIADIFFFTVFALGVISAILLGFVWFVRILWGSGGDVMVLLYCAPLYFLAPFAFILPQNRRVRFVIENKLPFLDL